MKIAFYHVLHKGGARKAMNEFARELKKLGHKVDLFTIDTGEKFEEKSFYNKISQYEFKPKIWKGHDWKSRLYKDSIELIKVYLLDKRIAKDISSGNYDLALISASDFIESPFILQFLSIPKFFYCHDPYYRIIYEANLFNKEGVKQINIYYEQVNRFIRKYLDRWNIKKADYIIFNSKFTKKEFEKTYKKRGNVSYIGIDTGFFKPQTGKRELDILYIGSYEFPDGYQLFKETMKKVKTKIKIRAVISDKEWLNNVQMRNLYQHSKILVATSFREPLGLVPLEAMSCGAAVIAVDDGGHKETVVDGVTGYIVKNDPSEMAKKIDSLLKNPQIIETMGKEAAKYVENKWNWTKRGKELELLLIDKLYKN